jgi:DNA/RNA endonuclease YhcR with UshA esterase domain
MRFATLILAIAFVPSSLVAQEEKTPLTPAEAIKKVDEKVTVRMEVKSTGGNTARYLNSETDYRSDKNFAVFIPQAALLKFFKAKIEEPGDFYKGKMIEVTGMVALSRGRPQIKADSPEQIKVIEKDAEEPKPKAPAKAVKGKGKSK